MIFETHAHYDDEQFDSDREELLRSMPERNVGAIVNVGATLDSSKRAMELANKYPYVYAAVGVHPDHVGELTEERMQDIKRWASGEKVVAIGEIGLDYYWDNESHEIQKDWFIRQLDVARELALPVLIHSRDAAGDTLKIMKEQAHGLTGVIHCFSYSKEIAREYVKMGFYIGVGGVVTFKNSRKLKEVVEDIPLSSILLETDCPYLAPVPYRGKRNDSSNLQFVAEEIAKLKNISYEEVVSRTEKNAKEMYYV